MKSKENNGNNGGKRHKTKYEIYAGAIELASHENGVKKTELMKKLGMSYIQLKGHLEFLIGNGLLVLNDDESFSSTTEGENYLNVYRNMIISLNPKKYNGIQPQIVPNGNGGFKIVRPYT